jgi:nicotinate dehydrogenase subunit A
MKSNEIQLNINGISRAVSGDPDRTLLDCLRQEMGLKGPKFGCGLAQCGACTVLIDGIPARACVLRTRHADGHDITTLEGLSDPKTDKLHPVQEAFLEMEGAQCGYCTNGMVMSTIALLAQNPAPTDTEIRFALRHNLCRCGAHTEIIASVKRAAQKMEPPA